MTNQKTEMELKIHRKSGFKDPARDLAWFEDWVTKLETLNERRYDRIELQTGLGKTHVWGLNTQDESLEPLVIFPGARTTSLFWDLDKGLDHLGDNLRVFLVETNGLPNLSTGNTPDIKSSDYGRWAAEVLDLLNLKISLIAGSSFGGLICMKLCIAAPEKVKAAFLLNPGCLQPFSLSPKNLYYNLLPILFPTRKAVIAFLNNAVFYKPHHQLSNLYENLITDYELFALKRYIDRTQKPYYMRHELEQVHVDTYLLEGGRDLLFPAGISINNAINKIDSLKDVKFFENVGHGIETYNKAMQFIGQKIKNIIFIEA